MTFLFGCRKLLSPPLCFWIRAQRKCNRLFDNPSVVLLHLVVNPSLRDSLSVGTFKCLNHPTVAGSCVLANHTLAVLLCFVRTRLFSKSAVKLASTSGKLFGTNASLFFCWRLKVVVLVIITVFFLIRHHAGKTRGYCTLLILLSMWSYGLTCTQQHFTAVKMWLFDIKL